MYLCIDTLCTCHDWQNRLGVSGPECTTDSKNYPHEVACGPAYTNVYFVIFVLGSNYLLLPLFIATLVEHFTTSADSDLAYVSMDDMEVYKATWILFEEIEDGNRDGFIPIWKLRPLIEELASRSCKLVRMLLHNTQMASREVGQVCVTCSLSGNLPHSAQHTRACTCMHTHSVRCVSSAQDLIRRWLEWQWQWQCVTLSSVSSDKRSKVIQ